MRQLLARQSQPRVAVPIRRYHRSFRALHIAVQSAAPLCERVVRRLSFACVVVEPGACLTPKHLAVAQPEQDSRRMVATAERAFERCRDVDRDIYSDLLA